MRLVGFRVLSLSIGVAVALALGELGLRVWTADAAGTSGTANQIHDIFHSPHTTVEFGLGYRPILNHRDFGKFGEQRVWDVQTRIFQSPYGYEKRSGVTRLLFVGDSVTHQGTIVDGLRCQHKVERSGFVQSRKVGLTVSDE